MDNQKIKVLCVEDEKEIRENIVDILLDEGFKVVSAKNGNEGFEVFLQEKPDIVISDIMMPDSSGYDLLKKIRTSNLKSKNTPIILLSALGQKEEVVKGVNSSANDYLIKPVDFDLLIAKIKEKVFNANKSKESHDKDVSNIKNQASSAIPEELVHYNNMISQYSKFLKKEPYGPFPHRKYLEDIDKIYMNSMKLSSLINNFISGEAMSEQINIDDEIVEPNALVKEFLMGLGHNFKNKITFDAEEIIPEKIKINKPLFLSSFEKLFFNLFEISDNSKVEIRLMSDHLGQFIFIFHVDGIQYSEALNGEIEGDILNEMLSKQSCDFEIVHKGSDISALIYVPAYRVIKGRN